MKDGMLSESALWGGTRYRPPPRSGRISQPDATSSRGNGHDRPHSQNLALPPLPQAFPNESQKLVASLRHEDPQEPVSAQGGLWILTTPRKTLTPYPQGKSHRVSLGLLDVALTGAAHRLHRPNCYER